MSHITGEPEQQTHDADHSRKNEPQNMFWLIFKDKTQAAFSYHHIYRIDFDGSSVIMITLLNDTVTIEGRNLHIIASNLAQAVQTTITEVDELHADRTDAVRRIEIAAS